MPHDTPDSRDTPDGVDPSEQPTQPMPEQQAGADAGATPGADAPTVAFEPVPAATEPIAPYVPIADYSASEPGPGGGTPPPALKPDSKSPVPWLIAAAVLIMGAAIAIGLWQPWNNQAPATTPSPSVTETPTIPPIETPTEEPSSEPTPTQEPEPEPTQEPEPDPAPTEIPSETPPEGDGNETPTPGTQGPGSSLPTAPQTKR